MVKLKHDLFIVTTEFFYPPNNYLLLAFDWPDVLAPEANLTCRSSWLLLLRWLWKGTCTQ